MGISPEVRKMRNEEVEEEVKTPPYRRCSMYIIQHVCPRCQKEIDCDG